MDYDSENMGDVIDDFKEQCHHAINISKNIKINKKPKNIIICGMGGSGIGGDLIKKFESKIPIITHHDYGLPNFADKESLVIIISYSGNTHEAISSYKIAKKIGSNILSITSGGKIKELNPKSIIIPSGYSPRNVAGYLFLLPLIILSNNSLIKKQDNSINEMFKLLESKTIKKQGKELSLKIKGKIPIIYSSNILSAVAYSYKTHINENAKQPAFCHTFPEMNHNEILGFKFLGKQFITIFLEDESDSKEIKKRMNITKKLIKNQTNVTQITVKGKSLLARIMYSMYLGDYISYFLAIENKINPSNIDLINKLKKALK
jgi:glucose/mannose-6-phosphate isomerase